jgi:hypothetical protein
MAEQADRATGTQRSRGPANHGLGLRIDELLLHGFRPSDRYVIAAAVERELGRLFTEKGVPPGGEARSFFQVDAGFFEVPHDATPDAVGTGVARAIHRSVGGASAGGEGAGGTSR